MHKGSIYIITTHVVYLHTPSLLVAAEADLGRASFFSWLTVTFSVIAAGVADEVWASLKDPLRTLRPR